MLTYTPYHQLYRAQLSQVSLNPRRCPRCFNTFPPSPLSLPITSKNLIMSFLAALRAPARRAAFAGAPRASVRTSTRTAFRKYSTAPEGKSSNTLLYAGLGGVVLAGTGYYIYASSSDTAKEAGTAVKSAAQSAKAAVNFVPSKEDYQKVIRFFSHFRLGSNFFLGLQ